MVMMYVGAGSREDAPKVLDLAISTFERHGFDVHDIERPAQQFTSLGVDVDTEMAVVRPTAKRLTRIIRAAQFGSSRPNITGRMLSRGVGHATHLMLVCRPLLSTLNHSFNLSSKVIVCDCLCGLVWRVRRVGSHPWLLLQRRRSGCL